MNVYDYHDDHDYEPESTFRRALFVVAMIAVALAGWALAWAAL